MVLHGHVPGHGQVRRYLSVDRISVARGSMGQVLAVLYQRRLTDTTDTGLAPDFIALGQDATGQHLLLSGPGFDGWVHDGAAGPAAPGQRPRGGSGLVTTRGQRRAVSAGHEVGTGVM